MGQTSEIGSSGYRSPPSHIDSPSATKKTGLSGDEVDVQSSRGHAGLNSVIDRLRLPVSMWSFKKRGIGYDSSSISRSPFHSFGLR
jgi:hypothetical protein